MNTTPFSGISLIAHLLIIGLAKLSGLFRFNVSSKVVVPKKEASKGVISTKVVASHLIVAVIFSIMFVSFTVAVRTGYREGRDEPQVKFVKEQAGEIKNWTWSYIFGQIATLE